MPIAAVLAPLAISFAARMGVRLAAKAAKALISSASSTTPAAGTPVSTVAGAPSVPSFAATLKDEQARIPALAVPVATPAAVPAATPAPDAPALPLGQVAYQQGVRSLALGAQTRARTGLTETGRHALHAGFAHRRPPTAAV